MATTAPLPSPAPSLTTPHLPGFFPSTPSPSAYSQSEGPLEAAGRSLNSQDGELLKGTTSSSAAPALLGAAAGMLMGGVGGAIAGASLFSVDRWEREGIQKKQGLQNPTGKENVPSSGATAPAADGPVAVAGEAHVVRSTAGGGEFVVLDANDETRSATPIAAQAQDETDASTPTEEKQQSHSNEVAEAAAVGAGAGALGAAAVESSAKPEYAEPVHNASNHRTANDKASSSSAPAPVEAEKAAPAAYPVVIPTQETWAAEKLPELPAEDRASFQEAEVEEEEPKKDKGKGKEVAEGVAAGAAVGAGAVAAEEYINNKDEPVAPQEVDDKVDNSALAPPPSTVDAASIHEQDPSPLVHQTTVIPDTRPPVSELLAEEEAQKAGPTPRDALNDELDESVAVAAPLAVAEAQEEEPAHGGSRFYEQLEDNSVPLLAVKPALVSRFSDATVETTANSTAASTPLADEVADPFDIQRAAVLNAHALGLDQTTPGRKVPKSALESKELPLEETGFKVTGAEPSYAQVAFAHLSSPAPTSPVAASAPLEDGDSKPDDFVPLAAAAGLAGIGAGTFAYEGHKADGVTDVPSDEWSTRPVAPESVVPTPARSSPAQTPEIPQRSPARELHIKGAALVGSSLPTDTGANTPSSTRAIRGSPPPTLMGADSFLADKRNDPESEGEAAEQIPPVFPNARSVQAQQAQSDDGRPVVRSPHAKIATRKDSIGHNKLHKKSIRVAPNREGNSSPLSSAGGSQRAASPALNSSPGQSPVVPQGRSRSGSTGAEMWDNSVAHVVNEETSHRGGQRPQLVTIESEDRRDNVMDRWVGVNDPTSAGSSSGSHGSPRSVRSQGTVVRHTREKSGSSAHYNSYRPGSPAMSDATHSAQQGPNKLHKERRRSSASEGPGLFGRVFGHRKSMSGEQGERRGSSEFARQ